MRRTTLKKITFGTVAVMIALALSQTSVIAQEDEGLERSVEGVWEVTTTPRNCTTGAPIPAAAFQAIFTFHKDGTMSVWAQNATITTTRSTSFGLWKRERGWSDYSFKFVHLRYNLSTGAFIGKQEAIGSLTLSDSGDEFTTDSITVIYDASGNPGASSCANSIATRFKLD